jgi:type IV fimbrial biogenesis protein FimT
MSRRQVTGFTLIELMVTISVLAILAAIAFPSFQGSLRSNRVATTTNELLASLSLARSEGIRSTRGGAVCTSENGTACGGDWNSGWIVWTDNDGDGALDAGEPIVRYSQGRPRVEMAGSATVIAFDGRGRSRSGAQDIGLSPEGVATPARCLQIGVTGQTRVESDACP